MKKPVTIAAIQSRVSGSLQANLEKTGRMVRQAAKKGAQIICLQELFSTPYFPQSRRADKAKFAEPLPGPATRLMASLAKKLGVVIIVPFYEKTTGGKYYNSAVIFDDTGKILGKYRKLHLPHDPGFYEQDYFEHGNSGYQVFKTKFAAFAVLICFDQWFPEAARAARLKGAEIIFYPTAIGYISNYKNVGDWHDAWETVQRGHAIANNVHIVTVNRVGKEKNLEFWGQSFACDPFGKILKKASKTREEILIQKIDLSSNEFYNQSWGFLRNRRPDTYGILTTGKLTKKTKKLQKAEAYKDMRKALESD